MKLKSSYLLLLLLFASYYQMVKPTELLKPFYSIKDMLFSMVHDKTSELSLSNEFSENVINNLREEIKRLEELNSINLSISDFEMINATVISRNRDYWFNDFTINKGISDGIDVDMAVIDSYGLIGRISMVTNNTATVKLITTNDVKNKISAIVHDGENNIYGIINGYDSVNNLLSLIVTDYKKINKNSIVETTGMGGIFPSGILIGKVEDIIKKDDEITNIIRVKPSSKIEGERYVSVLKRKEISSN